MKFGCPVSTVICSVQLTTFKNVDRRLLLNIDLRIQPNLHLGPNPIYKPLILRLLQHYTVYHSLKNLLCDGADILLPRYQYGAVLFGGDVGEDLLGGHGAQVDAGSAGELVGLVER